MFKSLFFGFLVSLFAVVEVQAQDSVGLELMKKSDCFTCHRIPVKLIGPSYKDVATKYKDADDAKIKELAQKIIKGGSGNWGSVPMKAHPELSEENAIEMVKFILSVNDSAAAPAPVVASTTTQPPVEISKKSNDSPQKPSTQTVSKSKPLNPEPTPGKDLFIGLALALFSGLLVKVFSCKKCQS